MAGESGFLTIRVDGMERARHLVTFGHAIEHLGPVWEIVGQRILADNALNMIGEGRLYNAGSGKRGSEWAPLAASTVAERERLGYGGAHPILYRVGYLAASLAERNAPSNIFEVTDAGVTAGTEVEYAGFHQRGTKRMPARAIVGLTRTSEEFVVRTLADYINGQIAEAGL